MLKSKAAKLLKKITLVVASMAKSKTLALKTKTNALRTKFMIFSLLRDKKVLVSSISHKLQSLVTNHHHHHHSQEDEENDAVEDQSYKAIVVCNYNSMSLPSPSQFELQIPNSDIDDDEEEEEEDNNKFPDLTHSLFDEDPGGSVIELVKKSKKEGEEFRLEDEIDQVADLFIRRFHHRMRMQKQLSSKRHNDHHQMLQATA